MERNKATFKKNSFKKNICFSAAVLLIMIILFELLSSFLLVYLYRYQQYELGDFKGEMSYFSSVNVIHKAYKVIGSSGTGLRGVIYKKQTDPDPFIIPDSALGYSASAGEYIHTFQKKDLLEDKWKSIKTKVTINKDGSRWTGHNPARDLPKVYIFGDSYVFGTGVNDEQTFSYLLQNAMPDVEVKLFAFGGYGLTQAYIRFENLKNSIKPNDIIVIGYANFYDVRNVMAPSRVRNINELTLERFPALMKTRLDLPKAQLSKNGEIDISYINRSCAENNNYCKHGDPSESDMTGVTAALINHIQRNTKAEVHLLHLEGSHSNPVFGLLDTKINRISALPNDFDYFIRDDVEGFDTHPGPYWHYAVSRKLLEALNQK